MNTQPPPERRVIIKTEKAAASEMATPADRKAPIAHVLNANFHSFNSGARKPIKPKKAVRHVTTDALEPESCLCSVAVASHSPFLHLPDCLLHPHFQRRQSPTCPLLLSKQISRPLTRVFEPLFKD